MKEKVWKKNNNNPMVIEGNIGHISIAKQYDQSEEEN